MTYIGPGTQKYYRAGLGGGDVTYLLRDLFTTPASAPLSSPLMMEPGGTLQTQWTVTDAENLLSKAGGKLVKAIGGTNSNHGVNTVGTVPHATGRAFLIDHENTTDIFESNRGDIGLGTTAFAVDVAKWETVSAVNTPTAQITSILKDQPYFQRGTFGFTRSATGRTYYTMQRRLCWVGGTGGEATTAAAKFWCNGFFAATSNAFDNALVYDLPGANWASDYGIATFRSATVTTGDTATSQSDAIVEVTWVAATGATFELMVRRVDDNNCWILRGSQAGATIKLIQKIAGAETEKGSTAQTWTNGTTYRITFCFDDDDMRAWVGTDNVVFFGGLAGALFQIRKTGVKVTASAGALSNLVCWPRQLALDTGTVRVVTNAQVVCDGDSLTLGSTAPPSWCYPTQMLDLLIAGGKEPYSLANYGTSGALIATCVTHAASYDVRYTTDYAKNILCVWIGTNDIAAGTTPAAAWAALLSFIQARIAVGWTVVAGTMLPRNSFNTPRATYNASITSNAVAQGYTVADLAANSLIGDDGDNTDLTYYNADQVHLNQTGYGVAAGIWNAAVAALL